MPRVEQNCAGQDLYRIISGWMGLLLIFDAAAEILAPADFKGIPAVRRPEKVLISSVRKFREPLLKLVSASLEFIQGNVDVLSQSIFLFSFYLKKPDNNFKFCLMEHLRELIQKNSILLFFVHCHTLVYERHWLKNLEIYCVLRLPYVTFAFRIHTLILH